MILRTIRIREITGKIGELFLIQRVISRDLRLADTYAGRC